jgi:hypothetical protein
LLESSHLELDCLGRVDFPWPVPPPETGTPNTDERRSRQAHRVYVDWQGRVWISELSACVIHGFDAQGLPSVDLVPDPNVFRPYRPVEWVSERGDGHLFVCNVDQSVQEFSPSGERLGTLRRIATIRDTPARWMFQSKGGGRWAFDSRSIDLDMTGGEVVHIDRGANRRWFQTLWVGSVAPDGGLAVLDEPILLKSRDPSTWVHLFTSTGEARRSLRMPYGFFGYGANIAFDGRRIALLHNRSLLLLNEDGSPIGRMTLSEELSEAYYLFFSPDGRELWAFPHMRHEMFRFALPP